MPVPAVFGKISRWIHNHILLFYSVSHFKRLHATALVLYLYFHLNIEYWLQKLTYFKKRHVRLQFGGVSGPPLLAGCCHSESWRLLPVHYHHARHIFVSEHYCSYISIAWVGPGSSDQCARCLSFIFKSWHEFWWLGIRQLADGLQENFSQVEQVDLIPWTIQNKYYTAPVHFKLLELELDGWRSTGSTNSLDEVPAIIFTWNEESLKNGVRNLGFSAR